MCDDWGISNSKAGWAWQDQIAKETWNKHPTASQKVGSVSLETLQSLQKSGFRWDTGSSGLSFPPIPPPVQSQLPFGNMSVQDQLQEIARHTLLLMTADLGSKPALNEIEKRA